MTPKDKFKKLVVLLYQRTNDKKIEWQFNQAFGTYAYVSGNMIALTDSRNEDEEPLEIIVIRNDSNVIVDRFNDEIFGADKPPIEGFQNYWNLMSNTRQSAYRQAIGADLAIDDILSELDLDDDTPF